MQQIAIFLQIFFSWEHRIPLTDPQLQTLNVYIFLCFKTAPNKLAIFFVDIFKLFKISKNTF